jgi:hypothetical protein
LAKIDIQIVDIQAVQAAIYELYDVFAAQTSIAHVFAHWPKKLAGDDQIAAFEIFDGLTHNSFGLPTSVSIGHVDKAV